MNDQYVEQMYGHIAHQIQVLTNQIARQTETNSHQGVAMTIKSFDGTHISDFKNWIVAIEKYAFIHSLNDDKKKLITYQSSSGAVSDYIKRFLDTRQGDNFETLKSELSHRFSDITDRAHAFSLLGKTKQKFGEGVQIYAERLLILAREAYDNVQDGAAALVDQQLIEFFIDGLREDAIKLKILRDKPTTYERAVKLAMDEQNLRTRFTMRSNKDRSDRSFGNENRDHVPMEVGHIRPKRRCFRCGGKHLARDCKAGQVNMVRQSSRGTQPLVCWNCGRQGHKSIECRDYRGQIRQNPRTQNKREFGGQNRTQEN